MKDQKSIVYLGCNSFPYGLAEVQKIILISKSLILTGNQVTVICKNGFYNKSDYPELKVSGEYEQIEYIYVSGSFFRNDNFIKRRIFEIKGRVNEIFYLIKRKKRKKLDFAIVSTRSFYSVLLYSVLSKLLGFKIILNYVEYYSAMKKEWYQINNRINDYLFDNYAPKISQAVFPISEFLINRVKKISPKKKYLKISALTDFEKYKDIQIIHSEKYFMFCGDAAYKEIIQFCIDSFRLVKDDSATYLYLIINGNENNILAVNNYIKNGPLKDRIKLFSKLSQKELFTYYKNALALLIPLRPTFQDSARFPHKTGEYLASGNPVISTNYGEIKFYFKDMDNMFLAAEYKIELFAEKMKYIIENPMLAQMVGEKGKYIASQLFDYREKATEINEFLDACL